jgi:hypothetical protein
MTAGAIIKGMQINHPHRNVFSGTDRGLIVAEGNKTELAVGSPPKVLIPALLLVSTIGMRVAPVGAG